MLCLLDKLVIIKSKYEITNDKITLLNREMSAGIRAQPALTER